MKFVKEKLSKESYVDIYKVSKPIKYKGRYNLTTAIRYKLANFRGMQAILRGLILRSEFPLPVVDKEGNVIRNEEVFIFCHCLGIIPEVIYL